MCATPGRSSYRPGKMKSLEGASTRLRVAGIVEESFVDGPGIRFVVFAQGCPHRCPGCHNPQTHSYTGGMLMEPGAILARMASNPLLDGLSLSGGEPFEQAGPFAELAEGAHARGYDVMTWTGYTFEFLLEHRDGRPGWRRLLEASDVLVDGPFLIGRRSLGLLYRGSGNQRVLDLRESLREGHAVLLQIR